MTGYVVALSAVAADSKVEATKMHERHRLDQEADNRSAGISSVPLSRDEVSRLKSDCAALMSLANRLEALAGDIHTSRRADKAHHLITCLRSDLVGHLDAEVAVLGGVGTVEDADLAAAIHRAQSEHAAARQLIPPVIRGLRSIRRDRLPRQVTDFVIETIVLCEFLRLHTRFKLETLYPLLARLKLHEAEVGEDRGAENGTWQSREAAEANGNASTVKTKDDRAAASWRGRKKSTFRNGRTAPRSLEAGDERSL